MTTQNPYTEQKKTRKRVYKHQGKWGRKQKYHASTPCKILTPSLDFNVKIKQKSKKEHPLIRQIIFRRQLMVAIAIQRNRAGNWPGEACKGPRGKSVQRSVKETVSRTEPKTLH
jgi:hypothetical protein